MPYWDKFLYKAKKETIAKTFLRLVNNLSNTYTKESANFRINIYDLGTTLILCKQIVPKM